MVDYILLVNQLSRAFELQYSKTMLEQELYRQQLGFCSCGANQFFFLQNLWCAAASVAWLAHISAPESLKYAVTIKGYVYCLQMEVAICSL